MKAVITADIINSSKTSSDVWVDLMKTFLEKFGTQGRCWDIYRGDEIQLVLNDIRMVFWVSCSMKILLKKNNLDARISIGIGNIDYHGTNIKESNGEAFIHSGRNLEHLKKLKSQTLGIKTSDDDFDENFNLIFKILEGQFDKWTIGTSNSLAAYLEYPDFSQEEIAQKLTISQGAFSRSLKRGGLENILEIDNYFRKRIALLK